MEHTYAARLGQLLIRPLEWGDLELLRQWRNDEKISKYFRKIGLITPGQQEEWYEKYLLQEGDYYWTVVEESRVIGALSIYNVEGTIAEIGKVMIGEQNARGKGYGYRSFVMAMEIGFYFMHVNIFNLNVHENNISALHIYKKVGFEIIGSHPFDNDGVEYEMRINKNKFKEVNLLSNNVRIYTAIRGGGIQ